MEDEPSPEEIFIRKNVSVLLSHPKILNETKRRDGQWKLHEINATFLRTRYIEFFFMLSNESLECFAGNAKIDLESCKISGVKVREC